MVLAPIGPLGTSRRSDNALSSGCNPMARPEQGCRCLAIADGLAVGSILSSQVGIHTQTRAPRSDNSIA